LRPQQRQYNATYDPFSCVEQLRALWPWFVVCPRTPIANRILDLQQFKSSLSEGQVAFLQSSYRRLYRECDLENPSPGVLRKSVRRGQGYLAPCRCLDGEFDLYPSDSGTLATMSPLPSASPRKLVVHLSVQPFSLVIESYPLGCAVGISKTKPAL
jgi:hypothetical protein